MTLNIFILTGQSNAQGCIEDGEAVENVAEECDREILFYWHLRGSGGDKVVSSSGGEIRHLQTQFFDNGCGEGHWGLEMSCFRRLHASGLRDVLVIKVTRGGGSNASWLKPGDDPSMYGALVASVSEALAEVRASGKDFRFAGLLYIQGESNGELASLAGERAARLLDDLKSELPNAGAMKMYIGGIAGFGPQRDLTRCQHRLIAGQRSDICFIDTADLLPSHQYKDQLHFNNAAKILIGNRFADAILRAPEPFRSEQQPSTP